MHTIRTAKLLSALCALLLFAILFFRAFVYSRLYIAPGDPYGISDLIELLLGCILILALVVSATFAAALAIRGPRLNRLAAAWLSFIVILIAVVAGPLHSIVARLASA